MAVCVCDVLSAAPLSHVISLLQNLTKNQSFYYSLVRFDNKLMLIFLSMLMTQTPISFPVKQPSEEGTIEITLLVSGEVLTKALLPGSQTSVCAEEVHVSACFIYRFICCACMCLFYKQNL